MIKANFQPSLPPSSRQSTVGTDGTNISSQKLEENFLLFSEHLKKPGIANNMLLELVFKNLSHSQRNILLTQFQNLASEGPDPFTKQADFAMAPGKMIVDERNGGAKLLKTHEQFLGNHKFFWVKKDTLSDDVLEQAQILHPQSSLEDLLTKPDHSPKPLPVEYTQDLGSSALHSEHIGGNSNKEVPSPLDPKGYYAEHPGVSSQQQSGGRQKSESGNGASSDALTGPDNLEKTSTSYFFKIATRCFVGVVVAILSMLAFIVLQ